MSFLVDCFAVACVSLGIAVVVGGCVLEMQEPTFADRCAHCGEYLEDAAAAHDHLRRCSPCR